MTESELKKILKDIENLLTAHEKRLSQLEAAKENGTKKKKGFLDFLDDDSEDN